MFQASKYWPGVLGVGILWVLANWVGNAGVEKDLLARAAAAIPKDTLDKPGVTIAGRDVTLTGSAFSAVGMADARSAVDATNGVRLVNAAMQPLTAARPYVFQAAKDAGRTVLTGNVPDPATRGKILAGAKAMAGAGEVVDQMGYAGGAPAGFDGMANFAVAELGGFSKGTSGLSDANYSISGEAASAAGFENATAALKKLPPGMVMAKSDFKAPFDKAAADAAAKVAANKAATDAAAKLAADKAAADAAAKLAADKAASDSAAKLAGDTAAADATVAAAATVVVPKPEPGASDLGAKDCQKNFNDIFAASSIEFAIAKAEINAASADLLETLAKTTKRCKALKIAILGHTDADGDPEANMALSERRAQAVMSHLVKDGIDADQLSAKGLGETQPIAPNDTAEGKAKNRRIEFIVQE